MKQTVRIVFLLILGLAGAVQSPAREHVILLHGLCRTRASMAVLERALTAEGYTVSNLGYPSRTASIETLGEAALGPALAECRRLGATKIHFVAHSLGAILVRSYFSRHPASSDIGHVVMLGPPNQGSEVTDRIGSWWLYRVINGPAGGELGTAPTSTPNRLGPTNLRVGVIAGTRTINWINSLVMIPGSDDGKVSVERTKLAGMSDHLVIPATHTFLMRNEVAVRQTVAFLRTGQFDRPVEKP